MTCGKRWSTYVGGQDIMTADEVTLRLNAVVTYKIVDARKAVIRTRGGLRVVFRGQNRTEGSIRTAR